MCLLVTGSRYALGPLFPRGNIIYPQHKLLPFLGQLLLRAEVILGCKFLKTLN